MPGFRRAFLINFASSSGVTFAQFIVSMLLARLLTPAEIGIYSMTIVWVNLAHVFRDFGVSSFIQREKDLPNEKIRAAIGVTFFSTWSIAALLFFSAEGISQFFGHDEMKPVMQVLSMGFLLVPFSSIMLSLLLRELKAEQIAWVGLAGTTAYAATCLTLAYNGFGTMSLAWANFANLLASGLAYLPMRPAGLPWLPSLKGWGEVMRFGLGSILSNAINAINNALPDTLLGKLGTPHQVGLLSRANSTVSIFSYIAGSAVKFGALPLIAQAHHNGQTLEPILSRATSLLTGIGWPMLAATALFSREIILILYGETWLTSIPAIPALALAAGITMLFQFPSLAMTAIGRPYLAAVPLGIMSITRISLAYVIFTSGIESFSWTIFWATLFTIPVLLWQQSRYLKYSIKAMWKAVTGSLIVTIVCVITCQLCISITPTQWSPYFRLSLFGPIVGFVWYYSLAITDHPMRDEVNRILRLSKIL